MTEYDDEIDLRPYITGIIQHWWLILILVVVFAAIGLGFSIIQPRKYEAAATILLTRSRPTLSLAQQFPTVNEPVDATSRMNAFLSLAQSDALTVETLKNLGDKLPIADREIGALKKHIQISSQGDAVIVTATANNPSLATDIANTWANQVVTAINLAYSGAQLPPEIQTQITSAQKEYQGAQTALEIFMQDNQKAFLQARVNEAQNLLDKLTLDRTNQVAYFTQRKETMDQLANQATALKQLLQNGNGSAAAGVGDAIAVLKARASVFGLITNPTNPTTSTTTNDTNQTSTMPPSASPPGVNPDMVINLQLSEAATMGGTPDAYGKDLDNLIQLAKIESASADENLKNLGQEVIQGQGYDFISQTAAQIQDLQTQLERVRAQERVLTSQRDLAWNAYQALAQKQTEIITTVPTSDQVTLAVQAVPPQKPTSRGTVRNVLIAGMLGLLIGVLWVFGTQWWQSTKSQVQPQEQPLETPVNK
jgi:capsular polysaccharide biosynthesis protein